MEKSILELGLETTLSRLGIPFNLGVTGEEIRKLAEFEDTLSLEPNPIGVESLRKMMSRPYKRLTDYEEEQAMEFFNGFIIGKQWSFYQNLVRDDWVSDYLRLSNIKKGFGVSYSIKDEVETIDILFNQRYKEKTEFDTDFYWGGPLFDFELKDAKISFYDFVQPSDWKDFADNVGYKVNDSPEKDFTEYVEFCRQTQEKVTKGMSVEDIPLIIEGFLANKL